jgi:Zn-dependent protease with chaperone function
VAMDFFEHQEQARKNSGRLVVLFCLAVAGIIASVYLAVMLFFDIRMGIGIWHPGVFVAITGAVLAVVVSGSLFKMGQLKGGGSVVARQLGGRRIDPGSQDPLERRLLNVVQEMAIASGTPVPDSYVLDIEPGINAFAAGHSEGDAVVAVTRGALEKLSRDELQAVMGHEFSHLLNGDMRLNLRLMGVIHGILLIGLIGRVLMQSGGRGGRRGKDRGGQIAMFGLALFVIGYLGTFFGNLIKAAVSRQREFLADASSVQFTRNADGLSHALGKIGGLVQGSRMMSARAAEASHMFFSDSAAHRFSSAMATHPPLTERIKRVDPSFSGAFTRVAEDFVALPGADEGVGVGAAAFAGVAAGYPMLPVMPGTKRIFATGVRPPVPPSAEAKPPAPSAPGGGPGPGSVLDLIGKPGPEHLARARSLWESVPEALREAARTPDGAVALSYAVLLAPPGPERDRQRALIRERAPALDGAVSALTVAAEGLDPEGRLPLLEVAATALGSLSPEQFEAFSETVRGIVEGDRVVELSEWVLSRLLLRHLRERLEPGTPPKARYRSIGAFRDEAAVLLSALAYAGHEDDAGAEAAFNAAAVEAGLQNVRPCGRAGCPPRALESALETFSLLMPDEKRRLVSACAASVAADRRVTEREAELFRVVADWMGAPVPPLLAGQLLA